MTDASCLFEWQIYKNATEENKEIILREMNPEKNLPLTTWEGQVSMLTGAPDDVIIKYMPLLYWRAQVVMFEKHLSVSAHEDAIPFLHDLAKRRLKLSSKPERIQKRRWNYW